MRRELEWILVDSHLWVSAAAAGLTLFAAATLGLPFRAGPAGIVFSATLLVYAVDDVFDGRMHRQPARWLLVLIGGAMLSVQLLMAPAIIVVVVTGGAVPALLYGAPIGGHRFRELPGVKPFYVAASLAVAAVSIPVLWQTDLQLPSTPRLIATGVLLFALILGNVCFFDLRDRHEDAGAGVRTIAVRLGVARTRRLVLVLGAMVAGGSVLVGGEQWPSLALAALATAAYARFLPVTGGRLQYGLVVDGVPVMLGCLVLLG